MAASVVMSSLSLKPSPFTVEKTAVRGLPSLARTSSLRIQASGKKIKTNKPFGINGGMDLTDGLDASGRKGKGKGVYQFVDKYGANVDGYSPIYNTDDWSPSGDVYVGGTTGLLIWAVTLAGILAGGALLVYSTSA
ncbi:TPA: photosystem II protein PsbR, partial [Escherichia coli]|nr:photosystem II protein PsbR [Escherichia coli]